jgi:predicted alpha/beta hydrolase
VSEPKPLTFHAADGTPLAGVLYEPAADAAAAQAPVLVAGALGVTQRYYAPFCSWLAGQGHPVMSFDPRGIGASLAQRPGGSLKGLGGDMLTWARQDFAGAVRRLASHSGSAVSVLGHSLGAHHAAMSDAATQARISRLAAVAAGSGYWLEWAWPSRWKAPLMLHLAGPLLTARNGYFPGARWGMVGDLPAGVMQQWTRWCRHPQFAWGAEPALVQPSLNNARFTVHAMSFSDDEAMTRQCTQRLLDALPNAPSQLQVLQPAEVGLKAIGHLGAFKRENAAVWPALQAALTG